MSSQSQSLLHGGSTIAQLFESALAQTPGRIALAAGEQQLTYRELKSRCWQVARELKARGLKQDDTVAFLMGNCVEAIVAYIAVQMMGVRVMSLHPLASQEDHRFVLSDAGARMLIADTHRYHARARALHDSVNGLIVVNLHESGSEPGLLDAALGQSDEPLPVAADPTHISKLAYTGGTTGRSKGIRQTNRTTVTMVMQMLAAYEWPEHPRYLATTPVSHAAGALILPTLLNGGEVHLMDKYSPDGFLEAVQRYRINLTFMVPTQIYGLLDFAGVKNYDISSLSLVLYGAAPIAPVRLAQALEKFGPVFGQLYGQAEAPMTIAYLPKRDHDVSRPHLLRSAGRPLPGNQVQLLGPDLKPVPVGEVGEVCVRGPLVMEGYLERPEENEKALAGGWLHTGDLARADSEGYLYLVDRAKDMIISGGFNVYPSEVENCLAQHPAVAMSAVVGVPHEKWGEVVTAVVVLKPDATCTSKEVIDYVVQHKGVVNAPKQVHFTNALTLTALGKVDKKALRALYQAEHEKAAS